MMSLTAGRSEAPKPCCLRHVGKCIGRICFDDPVRERAVTTSCRPGAIMALCSLAANCFFHTAGSSRHFPPVLFFIGSSLFTGLRNYLFIVPAYGQFLCYIYSKFGGSLFSEMQNLQVVHRNCHRVLRIIGEILRCFLKNPLTSSICCPIIKMQVAFHVTHYSHKLHICQVQHDQIAKEVIQ